MKYEDRINGLFRHGNYYEEIAWFDAQTKEVQREYILDFFEDEKEEFYYDIGTGMGCPHNFFDDPYIPSDVLLAVFKHTSKKHIYVGKFIKHPNADWDLFVYVLELIESGRIGGYDKMYKYFPPELLV